MSAPLSEQEKAIVRALQQELPLVPEPYRVIAADLGLSEAALLEGIRSLQEKGCLKRISIEHGEHLSLIGHLHSWSIIITVASHDILSGALCCNNKFTAQLT